VASFIPVEYTILARAVFANLHLPRL